MKSIFYFIIILFFSTQLVAQAPAKFQYQAVARDANGQIISGNVQVRIAFLADSPDGVSSYIETHDVATNPQGIFDLKIGDGVLVSGDFDNLNWSDHQYWLKMELKTPQAAGFTEMGKTQLLSVPYAMYAAKSGSSLEAGTGIKIENGIISNTGDLSDEDEFQELNLNGNYLSISNGNGVTLPSGGGSSYSAGQGITINNNNVISATDASTSNELQQLALNGFQLNITNGNSVNLPSYAAGNGMQLLGTTFSALDASPTNEIQSLSLNGNQLSLSNGGGSVQLPQGQSNWSIANSTEITSTPASNSVVIGSTSDFGSRLYVSASGSDHAGNFYSPSTGNAVNAYCNGTGKGVNASSLNGVGGYFSSVNSHALITGGGNVGIGVSDPDFKLQVAGQVDAEGISSIVDFGVGAIFSSAVSEAIHITQNSAWKGIEWALGANDWEMALDGVADLAIRFNDNSKGYFSRTDGAYHNYSDRALKKDIRPFTEVLPGISKLQAYTYHMVDAKDDDAISLGLMAQEVEEQFPQLVTYKEGYRSICYDHFAVLSIQAIKEQQVEIADLKSRLEKLEKLIGGK